MLHLLGGQLLAGPTNPFGNVNPNISVDSSNPILIFFNPLSSIGLIVLLVMVIRVFQHYLKGAHNHIGKEVIVALIVEIICFYPTVFGPMVGWVISKVHG